MEITLEMVERLREKADVSYTLAKRALEFSGGNLLDALIYLEEKGYVDRPDGGNYSTQQDAPSQPLQEIPPPGASAKEPPPRRTLGDWVRRLVQGVIDNEVELWRRDQCYASIPVLIPLVLLICTFWIMIPLLLVGLLFGFRYRFSGPDLEREDLNGFLRNVADSAAQVGQQVMDELNAQHEKHSKKSAQGDDDTQ